MDREGLGTSLLWASGASTLLALVLIAADRAAWPSYAVFAAVLLLAIGLAFAGLEPAAGALAAGLAVVPLATFFFAYVALAPAVLTFIGAMLRWSGHRGARDPGSPSAA